MSRIRFNGKFKGLRLVCAAGALMTAFPATGQEGSLRGTVGDTYMDSTLRAGRGMEAAETPRTQYRPTSAGALPDSADEDGTLFPGTGSLTAEDPFPPLDRPASTRGSATAAENENRAEEAAAPSQEAEPAEQLDDLATGTARVGTIDATEGIRPLPLRTNERVEPIEGRARRTPEDDPYAPLGLRIGTFTVVPTLEQGLTWTTNADSSPGGEEALLSETTLRLNAVSGWSRHRAVLNGYGTYRKSVSGDDVSEFEGGADAALELDLRGDLSARAALAYAARRESASSPVAIAGVVRQPLRHTIDGSLGVEKAVGKLRLRVTGEVSRNQYGDARLDNGDTLSQSDRNSTLALVRLRGGYELSPALIPFLEVEAGRRFYDEERDSAGYARSATRLGARAGLSLDISEKLSGEVSAGWVAEDFEDDRLDTVSGLALAAALNWSPMRGTNVRLDGSTTVEGSTDAGDSGSLLYSGTLRLERQMRSNLTGDVALGAAWRDYSGGGHDLILSGEASLTWWLNRYAGLTGRARHERQKSNLPGRDYEATSIFMGMTLQR
ncbi:outer membrane beta-barrel protein [Chelativorans salis]|uniref:Outer membrane beta-barrel protein n=1 Tax=Chelativorans salis TaxID=2978478 RepID=A0ABT2LSJ9_9HYPH|nr:outer membrane beta-barrel protein [Chelativorans sp. EGI FJ00035]MCT7377515.1 outer membrane beta-barrel protein [Chelativorans sp. EGI FJ00035]